MNSTYPRIARICESISGRLIAAAGKRRVEVSDSWQMYFVHTGLSSTSQCERLDAFLLRTHLKQHLDQLDVEMVLDIGAHRGGFLRSLRRSGYMGSVVCFEPTGESCDHLETTFASDPNVRFCRVALGERDGEAMLNAYASSDFNSVLSPTDETVAAFGQAVAFVDQRRVRMQTLRDFIENSALDPAKTWLKIDVQGAEFAVLKGAGHHLATFAGVLLEGAFEPLYVGAKTIPEMVELLKPFGLRIAGMYAVNRPEGGLVNEYDCIFVRQ